MEKLKIYSFCTSVFIVCLLFGSAKSNGQIIYENCPNQELSFSILDEETKMCANNGRGGSGSSVTFLVCNPDPIQCCPGLDIPQEPSCYSLAG